MLQGEAAAIAVSRRRVGVAPIAVVVAAVAFLSSAFLYGTPPDEEELRFAVLAAWLHSRALFEGGVLFWSPHMGLGIPQPFVPNFSLHPLASLLAWMGPVGWARLVLAAHTLAGAVGMWRLCRRCSMSGLVAAVSVATYLLAAPVHNYLLSDFWPSHYFVWTAVPWILLLAWRLLEADDSRSWRTGVLLGLLAGLTLANTNPGHATIYLPLGLGLLTAHYRAVRRHWAAVCLAVVIALAICSPLAAHLLNERARFDAALSLSNLPEPLPIRDALAAALRPLTSADGTRTLFFGPPFLVLAAVGCVWFIRTRADLVIAMTAAALMLFTSWPPAPVSARYQFRDPVIICAIVLAGCAAERLWSRPRVRSLAGVCLLLQAAAMFWVTWPLVQRTWARDRTPAFRGATADTPLADRLVASVAGRGRLLYSPEVDHAVAERALVEDGLGLNALAYRDVAVVTGLFKGVSTDAVWPNDRLFYGLVRSSQPLLESDGSLDVLGIRYVLARRGEPVAAGLREVWSARTIRGLELVLFENPDASPGGFIVDPARLPDELPRLAGCGHDRLLCRDLGTLDRVRDRYVTSLTRDGNAIVASWPVAPPPRFLVVAEMYREGWTATADGQPLEVLPLYGGLIGVALRPNVTSVTLRYRPAVLQGATVVSYVTIALAAVLLLATAVDRRRDLR